MKILFSTYTTAFQNPGGGENVIIQLRRFLVGKGHQVEIFNPIKHQPTEFDIIHHFSAIESDLWYFFSKFKKPIVVTPTVYLKKTIFGLLRWKIHLWGKRLEQFSMGNPNNPFSAVDLWLAATKLEAAVLHDFYSIEQKKIFVLPNGVDINFSKSSPTLFRNKTGIEGPFVLHVGRFHPVKKQTLLIRACANINIPMVFIGGADEDFRDYRNTCISLARQLEPTNESKLFHFFDREPFGSDFLKSAYAAAAVFALPSEFESFGISALEAMAAGVPCVLSENVADKTIFPRAVFAEPNDLEAWCKAIQKSLSSANRPSEDEIVDILQRYSWNRITDILLKKYEELIELSNKNS